MKSTWRKIIIVSFVLVFIETVGSLVLLLPFYKMQRIFDNIDAGQWPKVQAYYEDLNEKDKQKALSYLDDYGAYVCQRYIDGEINYENAVASMDAINAIDESNQIYQKYVPTLSHDAYKQAIDNLYNANIKYDTKTAFEAQQVIAAINQRVDNDTREKIMIEMLNQKYRSFLNEEMTAEQMISFSSVIIGLSYYDAHYYAANLAINVEYVLNYRGIYENALSNYEQENYFAVLDMCGDINIDPYDSKYTELFTTLKADAYDTGKSYYEEKLDDLIGDGDKDAVLNLINDIEKYYGDDFNLDHAKASITEDWQSAYMTLTDNCDTYLHADLATFETGRYIIDYEWENLKPDSLLLYDVDGDEVPELLLFNSQQTTSYTGCFMYGYDGTEAVFIDYVNVLNFCSDSNIIAFPIAFGRGSGDEYLLKEYSANVLSDVKLCQQYNSTYYVDGEETNDADYLSARTSILEHTNEKTVLTSDYSSLDDSIDYIMAY